MGQTGLNISATYTYATGVHGDAPCHIATDGSTGDDYPTVFANGLTGGWTDRGTGAPRGRDRTTSGDERLRGIGFNSVTIGGGAHRTLRMDRTGSGKFRVGLGDDASGQTGQSLDVRDSIGSLFTVTGDTGAGEFRDAGNNLRTSASDWATNNAQSASHNVVGHIEIRINEGSGTATALAHVSFEDDAVAAPKNLTLLGVG